MSKKVSFGWLFCLCEQQRFNMDKISTTKNYYKYLNIDTRMKNNQELI